MTEVQQDTNTESFKALASESSELYSFTLTDRELHSAFLDARYNWDKNLKIRCIEKYGSTKMLQEVPSWQTLIGGTVEEEINITAEQRTYINQEVSKFVKEFKESHNLR